MFVWTYVSISLEYIPRGETVWLHSNSIFNILKNCQIIFRNSCTILHSYQQCLRVLPLPTLVSIRLFDHSKPSTYEVLSYCGFGVHILMANVASLFTCLLAFCMSSLEKCLFRSFAHFLIGLSVNLLLSCNSSLFILNTSII